MKLRVARNGTSMMRERRLPMFFGEAMSGASEVASDVAPAATETAESFCKTPEMLNDYAGTGIAGRCTEIAGATSGALNAGIDRTKDFCASAVRGAGDMAAKGVEWGANKLGSAAEGVGNAIGGPVGMAGGMLAKNTIESGGAFAAGGIRTAANSFGDTIGGTTGSGGRGGFELPGGKLPGGDQLPQNDGCWGPPKEPPFRLPDVPTTSGPEIPRDTDGTIDFKSPRYPGTPPIVDPNAQPRGPEDVAPSEPPSAEGPPVPTLDEPPATPAPEKSPETSPDPKKVPELTDEEKMERYQEQMAKHSADSAKEAMKKMDEQKATDAAEAAKKADELSTMEKLHHDWIMDDNTKADMDRAIQAQDALNGDDAALQKFIEEDMKQNPSMGKKAYRWWDKEGYNAKAREQVRAEYEKNMDLAATKNGISRGKLNNLVDYHRKNR